MRETFFFHTEVLKACELGTWGFYGKLSQIPRDHGDLLAGFTVPLLSERALHSTASPGP